MHSRALIVVFSLLLLGASTSYAGGAEDAAFGDTVTTDIKLQGDISGSGDGLVIGASGITINLNGYTISSTDGTGVGIRNDDGYDDVTIKNGTIDGFTEGIRSDGGDDLTIKDITVDGSTGSINTEAAIHVLNCESAEIKDCDVTVDAVFIGAGGIRLDSVADAEVEHCDIHGGFLGINFSSVTEFDDPTTGEIKDCDLDGCFIGILMANTDDAEIKDCVVTDGDDLGFGAGAPQGIRLGLQFIDVTGVTVEGNTCTDVGVGLFSRSFGATVSDIEVKDNTFIDSTRGIVLFDTNQANVKDNTCTGHSFFGIAINQSDDNEVEGNVCSDNLLDGIVFINGADDNLVKDNECNDNGRYGIGMPIGANIDNTIEDNEATGNGVFDCFHNLDSTPNTWKDNECDTTSGSDIDSSDDDDEEDDEEDDD